MLLLISDANILMDVEVGDLVAPMFSLGYEFAVPNVLYYEELEDQHAHLLDMGLQVRNLTDKGVGRVQSLSQTYSIPACRSRPIWRTKNNPVLKSFQSPS